MAEKLEMPQVWCEEEEACGRYFRVAPLKRDVFRTFH